MIRVGCYIDGFNLYHSIDDMSRATRGALNHLKWLDVHKLMHSFIDPAVHRIVSVKYFSAYPTWKPAQLARHKSYVRALQNSGVTVVLGQFKEKDAYCKNCNTTYKAHEEKESDVNFATHLINDSHLGLHDQVFMVTRDSDLSGPMRAVRANFPAIKVKIIAPPNRRHSKELWALAHLRSEIKQAHLEKSLLPARILDANGVTLETRPAVYDPPI